MSTQLLHHSLLRPAIIHILRAAGFHSTRPSVLDTLTDLAARYLALISSRTAYYVYDRTSANLESSTSTAQSSETQGDLPSAQLDDSAPSLSDVRNALTSISFFSSSLTSSEEAWREVLRRPISSFSAGAQEKEQQRRDAEDIHDVKEFIEWALGPVNKEIRRIAGVLREDQLTEKPGEGGAQGTAAAMQKDDYLAALKKKHSRTGDGTRYAGTALGGNVEEKGFVSIDGGPQSLEDWKAAMKKRAKDEMEVEKTTAKRRVIST